MYDHTGIGAALHSKVFLALGLWHNFKQASLLIWKTFALRLYRACLSLLISRAGHVHAAKACSHNHDFNVFKAVIPPVASNATPVTC